MKTILITVTATLGAVFLCGYLFLDTVLGVFNLVAMPVNAYQEMRTAQQVVSKMKQRSVVKKSKVAKRLGKRAAKRVGASVMAAATVGTVAVAATVTGLEISDYCDEKKELLEDESILNGTNTEFDMGVCLEEGKKDAEVILDDVKSTLSDAMDSTATYSADKWADVKQATIEAASSASGYLSLKWEEIMNSWPMTQNQPDIIDATDRPVQ